MAFLDIHPINPGHTLVAPRRHVVSFTDVTAEELWSLSITGRRIAAVQKTALACDGVTLSLADGEAAGQEVVRRACGRVAGPAPPERRRARLVG